MQKDKSTIKGNMCEHLTDMFFKTEYADYQVAANEVDYYHVAMEPRTVSRDGRQRLTSSRVQKFHKKAFEQAKKANIFQLEASEILHNPEKN